MFSSAVEDAFAFAMWMVSALAVMFGGMLLFALVWTVFVDRPACASHEQITGQKTEFSIMAGCYVQSEHGWMRLDDHRAVQKQKYELTTK
jgi:hypothetical protein